MLSVLGIKEMHIKSMRHYFTHTGMANITDNKKKCQRGCGDIGTLVHFQWECKMVQPIWNTVWQCLI